MSSVRPDAAVVARSQNTNRVQAGIRTGLDSVDRREKAADTFIMERERLNAATSLFHLPVTSLRYRPATGQSDSRHRQWPAFPV